ncbi:mechanosensitive ion channel-like protein [Algoriphagus boseongensis]|uniref:Mechanosensitive ion channel-like protein n=1 Tax=Algoriphagus boseongensis TaxID=1442587 RepID=A0A4R6TDD8_9BACT|nr:mechanosensitive ion channel family protein [Algoriphagus boseongensis]TDQ19464.1 mechanosensitive ion channel-like protein [Algoriphagus boseongensis]
MKYTRSTFWILVGLVSFFLFSFTIAFGQNSTLTSEIISDTLTLPGYPVYGSNQDTLFLVYSRLGSLKAEDRAARVTQRIYELARNDRYNSDSLKLEEIEGTMDVLYGDQIIVSISSLDAKNYGAGVEELALRCRNRIDQYILEYQKENQAEAWLLRIVMTLAALLSAILIFYLVGKGTKKLEGWIRRKEKVIFKDLSYKGYTFLNKDQEIILATKVLHFFKWVLIFFFLYLLLPILFSIFPFSRDWSEIILNLVLDPVKDGIRAIWDYLPNLFSILVIVIFVNYLIRFVRFVFKEIQDEKLNISGFHPDWAMPTYNIARFLLLAFMLVLIFPYLPGSDSVVFKGVSVFLGILFSLGSSSAITNMIAGLVITYMRPFKLGDRIKIADATGDVIEKTLLVTRIRTTKNEIITIPNSSVLSGNTVNYSLQAEKEGLILHTTITLGYDIPWPKVHKVLIDAAIATEHVMTEPKPFVLQTSLDDFYVSYQLNAYTKMANIQAKVYSELHQNIQDFCRDNDIEIMSPHYRANRDGSDSTIPSKE